MSSSITINSNLASLNAQRRLGQSTSALQTSFTRLSSGLRINKASDDSAGLAISESLNVDARVFGQGIRNLNDGLSTLAVADAAVEELSNIVIRLQELAEQAANGTLGHVQRRALDEEAQTLSDEYFRIAQSTEFNGRYLLRGDYGELSLQGGYGTDGSIVSALGGAVGDGSFSETQTLATETSKSNALSLGDLNGDGVLDLVTAGYDGGVGEATVFLGTGDGTFSEAQTLATEAQWNYALSLGDLNGDGVLDLVTAGYDGVGGGATVFLGTGDGTFSEAQTLATETSRNYALSLGDLNGDGVLDLVTAGYDGPGEATVFLGGTTFGAAPLLQFSLSSQAEARQALPVFQRKLAQLAEQRGAIGAFQARVGVAINTMQVERENYLAARSQITDADVAWESAQLVRNNILQQAGAAVLAQANQAPALALTLLGGV